MKKGYTHGGTDEFGIKAVEGRMHTNDLHATLLALMVDSFATPLRTVPARCVRSTPANANRAMRAR